MLTSLPTRPRGPVAVATGPVVHVAGPLDQLTVGHLDGCLRRARRPRPGDVVLVLDPPRSLQIACEVHPGRLDLVPATVPGGPR